MMKLFQTMLKVYWRKAGKSPPHKTDVTRDGNAAQHSEIPEAKDPEWDSKKLKIRCFLCIWRLATYVIILYKPYTLSGYCDNWISQSKNISKNILRDYSDFDLFVTTTVLWVRKSIPLALFEVFRLRKRMRPFAASDIFYRREVTFYSLRACLAKQWTAPRVIDCELQVHRLGWG